MSRVILISNNRVLIERITFMISSRADLNFCLLSTSRYETIVSDIESFKADIAIIDAMDCITEQFVSRLCKTVTNVNRVNKCFLLIDKQESSKQQASKMQTDYSVNDYIIYEDSLENLFSKLKE